jgi:hypothetical protein
MCPIIPARGRHGRLRLPASAAHLSGAGHCGRHPRWAAAEGTEACRCCSRTGRLPGTLRERPGASAIDTKLFREVRSRGRTVGSKAETDRRAAGVSTCLSGLCTEAPVLAGDVGRPGSQLSSSSMPWLPSARRCRALAEPAVDGGKEVPVFGAGPATLPLGMPISFAQVALSACASLQVL